MCGCIEKKVSKPCADCKKGKYNTMVTEIIDQVLPEASEQERNKLRAEINRYKMGLKHRLSKRVIDLMV